MTRGPMSLDIGMRSMSDGDHGNGHLDGARSVPCTPPPTLPGPEASFLARGGGGGGRDAQQLEYVNGSY